MKKLLPKSFKNIQGFTLIELMVAIAIIAILSVVGLTVFNNTQKNARDTKRRGDINAIAKALENKKVPGTIYYLAMAPGDFAGSVVPSDPKSGVSQEYCLFGLATIPPAAVAAPAAATNFGITTSCSGSGITGVLLYPIKALTTNPPDADKITSWSICMKTESTPTKIECVYSQ